MKPKGDEVRVTDGEAEETCKSSREKEGCLKLETWGELRALKGMRDKGAEPSLTLLISNSSYMNANDAANVTAVALAHFTATVT